jgi:hypothetical protein
MDFLVDDPGVDIGVSPASTAIGFPEGDFWNSDTKGSLVADMGTF